jgi:uncharacterized protein (TIGR02594 family)
MYAISRRTVASASLAIPFSSLFGARAFPDHVLKTLATDIGSVPPLPQELRQYSDRDDLNAIPREYEKKGIEPALVEERRTALSIVSTVPVYTSGNPLSPIDIARYFLSIAQNFGGKFDPDWPGYMRAWPIRANPLIVEFFGQTKTTPVGDTTAWCSAFLNWCVARSRIGRPDTGSLLGPTHDAASSSWRKWGPGLYYDRNRLEPRNGTPQVGDIVVFVDRADTRHGHVCFYLARQESRLRVLGGNQLEGKPLRHVISEKLIPLWDGALEIHSIRTDRGLHT